MAERAFASGDGDGEKQATARNNWAERAYGAGEKKWEKLR